MSPLAFINLVGIALAIRGLEHPSHQITDPPLAPLSPVRDGQARVVWIIFDEADQRLGFEQRPANLQMPEFDRFRHESLYATNAYPPGTNTLESLPGLTTGQRILMASIKNARELALTLADTGKVVLWEDLPSVFDSARALGVNTALVGWHHPYDRVLGRSLNYCSWYPYTEYELVRGPTVGGAMFNQLGCLALEFHLRGVFAGICRASLADSLALVTTSAAAHARRVQCGYRPIHRSRSKRSARIFRQPGAGRSRSRHAAQCHGSLGPMGQNLGHS